MSLTLAGLIVLVLSSLAKASGFNLHIGEAEVSKVLTTSAEVIGLAMAYYGRVRQGNITWYGKRLLPN